MKPTITEHDATTGITINREMTDDEYSTLVKFGWTSGDEPTPEPTSEEETIEE